MCEAITLIKLTGDEQLEHLEPHEGVEGERVDLLALVGGWVGVRAKEEGIARKMEDHGHRELHGGLAEDHLPHGGGD